MSRHSTQRSYRHRIRRLAVDTFVISYIVDRYHPGSRLRYPTSYQRVTGADGARRFARKHGVDLPSGT